MADDPGSDALGLFDKLLRERPEKVGHDFSAATRSLTAYRDRLVAAWRESRNGVDRQRMARAHAVLSVLVGCHYPLGRVQWQHLERAREMLAGLLGEGPRCVAKP